MRLVNAVVMSLLFASSANAATYYVATTGNDSASGSTGAPFATIGKAASIAAPGDVVNVRGGVYTGRNAIYSKGTASAPIVFRAMAGETVILDGTGVASNKGVVELTETEYVDFSGFEVRNAPYIGIVLWHARNTRVLDNHIHHTVRNGIYAGGDALGLSSDITVSGNSVHDTVLENQYRTFTSGGWAGAVVVSKTERATITGNKIWNNDGEGLISLRGNNTEIRNNEIFDNFSVNLYLDNARFVTADRNLIYSTGNTRYYRNGLPAAGISVANETKSVMNHSSDNVFTNNIVIGTRFGFYYGNYESGGGLRNTKVLHNTFVRTTEAIIRIDDDTHSNSLVANNIFYQVGSPAPTKAGAGLVTFRSNLWYGGSAGPAAGTADVSGDPLFINAAGLSAGDYQLRNLSLAIHKAADISGVATDFWGNARTPTFDIGAHEHSVSLGSSSPATPEMLAPSNVRGSLDGSSVHLNWTAVEGATSYRVYRNRSLVATTPETVWIDSTAGASTTYSYAVTAVGAGGNESAPSANVTVTTDSARDITAPTAPGNLTATAISGSVIELSWTAATDDLAVAGYAIYRDGTQVALATGTSWTDSGLAEGTTYRYEVAAYDTALNHSQRATVSATTPAAQGGSSRRRAARP